MDERLNNNPPSPPDQDSGNAPPDNSDYSRKHIIFLTLLAILCCLGVPLVSSVLAKQFSAINPWMLVGAGVVLTVLTLPLDILSAKKPRLCFLGWFAMVLNTIGSGFCSAAYSVHCGVQPTLSQVLIPAMIPVCVLLLFSATTCLLPEKHRDTVVAATVLLSVVMLIIVIVLWIIANSPLFFGTWIFSAIMELATIFAMSYAFNEPKKAAPAFAAASCCYLSVIALVVILILACAGGGCDNCDCDGCECGDCCECGGCDPLGTTNKKNKK